MAAPAAPATPTNAGVPVEHASSAPVPPKPEAPPATDASPAAKPDSKDTTSSSASPDASKAAPVAAETPAETPNKELSSQKDINDALEKMGKKLFDQKDPRVATVALARMAGEGTPTDLANELRYDVVRELQGDESAPEELKNLSLPDKPEQSALEDFLKQHPNQLARDILRTAGGMMTAEEFNKIALTYSELQKPYFDALLGEGHATVTAADMLNALHIDATPETQKQFIKTIYPQETKKPSLDLGHKTLQGFFIAFMITQFCLQLNAQSKQRE